MYNHTNSKKLQIDAEEVILGGVNSPSRSYKAVGGGAPLVMERAEGPYFYDVDGNKYIDYLAAYGPIITGHAHPRIHEAITEQSSKGILYGTSTQLEIDFARKLRKAIPSLERVRFVNSGTEAVMTTIRVARAYTNRNKIIKFEGCYHGHSDRFCCSWQRTFTTWHSGFCGRTGRSRRDVITVLSIILMILKQQSISKMRLQQFLEEPSSVISG